jgi:aminoglycoside phosphotransferase family enzyme
MPAITHSVPTLEVKLAFLRRPDSYPDTVEDVEAIETHMAWVFLAGNRAYKLKKPVRYSFLDYSTLEARRRICEDEVRLNRRLAPDVYLRRLPLVQQSDGTLSLGGEGVPVEWLVEMRRLHRVRMLSHAVASKDVHVHEVTPAASLLADFFARASPEPLTPAEYVQQLRADLATHLDALIRHPLPAGDERLARGVSTALLEFLEEQSGVAGERARDGRIIEGHGDLRPEHIYLGPPPAVIDCIEFSRRFRVQDPADELAFLTLELERQGDAAVARVFLDAYETRTRDRPPDGLLHFYAAGRGLLRAKLAIEHLEDGGVEPLRWIRRGHEYLCLAAAHARRMGAPAGAARGRFPIPDGEVEWT